MAGLRAWREELSDETFFEGAVFYPGTMHGVKGVWGTHREVCFANGVIALISVRTDKDGHVRETMEAVKVPGKRGHRLYVNGQSHWKKWGRIYKGVGPAWADRKTWNDLHCPWALWNMCRSEYGTLNEKVLAR